MSAWQIPLSGTPAPRQNAFEAVQEAELNDTRNKLGQQQVLSERARLAQIPQEDALREQQTRGLKIQNDAAEAAAKTSKAYYDDLFGDHKDHPAFADDATPAAAATPATAPLSAPPPTPAQAVEPQRFDEFGRQTHGQTVLGPPMGAIEANAEPPRQDEFGRQVVHAPEPMPSTVPQIAPAAAPQASPQAPLTTGSLTAGTPAPAPMAPTVNRFERAMRAAFAAGGGEGMNELQKSHYDILQKQATLQKEQAEAIQRAGEQVSSILTPIKNAPPEQREAMYQRVLPTIRQIAPQLHVDPSHIPEHYDAQFLEQGVAFGVKAADQARIAKEGADGLRMTTEQNLKNAEALEKRYRNELSDPKLTAADLAIKNDKYAAYAKEMDPSGTLGKAFDGFKITTWSQDIPERMNQLGMTPEQRAEVPRKQAQDKLAERRVAATELNARTNASRLGNENATRHKEMISQLADQAISESYNNGGKTLEDVLANLDPAKNFYQGHPIGKYRGEVQAEIQHRRTTGPGSIKEQMAAIKLKDAQTEAAYMEALDPKGSGGTHPATPPPPSGGRGTPTTAPLAPKPATAPAAQSTTPAPAKYTESQIRQHAVSKGYDANGPEANAAVAKARAQGSLQ